MRRAVGELMGEPAARGAHDTVRAAVLGRLDHLDRAADADAGTLLPLARSEIMRIADCWRVLLSAHERDGDGRCETCQHRLKGRRWPCPIWKLAYEQLIGEGLSHGRRAHPLHSRFPRMGRATGTRRPAGGRDSAPAARVGAHQPNR